ncbi:MAG: siderophore-interacting protein, partial [Mycetocola sp.]
PWAYSAFDLVVARTSRLSPGFMRLTLHGESLRFFAPWLLDQRIKIVLPLPGGVVAECGLLDEPTPHPSNWYTRWKQLPEDNRNVLRTYTPAAIRVDEREIDVDVLLHDPAGPASLWALAARPGDRVVITGPDIRMGWTGYGLAWEPGEARSALLVGDESALPAMRNIAMQSQIPLTVFLEVGDRADDLLTEQVPSHITVHRVDRDGGPGAAIERAVAEWIAHRDAAAVPEYVWIAGEAGSIIRTRRYVTEEGGINKARVSFLGYWKHGGPLVG